MNAPSVLFGDYSAERCGMRAFGYYAGWPTRCLLFPVEKYNETEGLSVLIPYSGGSHACENDS